MEENSIGSVGGDEESLQCPGGLKRVNGASENKGDGTNDGDSWDGDCTRESAQSDLTHCLESLVIAVSESATQQNSSNAMRQVIDAIELLIKLLKNICDDPSNSKFHTIKKANPTVKQKLMLYDLPVSQHITSIFLSLGFEETNETFFFPVPLSATISADRINQLMTSLEILNAVGESIRISNDRQNLPAMAPPSTPESPSSSSQISTSSATKSSTSLASSCSSTSSVSQLQRRKADPEDSYQKTTKDLQLLREEQRARHALGGSRGACASFHQGDHQPASRSSSSSDRHRGRNDGGSGGLWSSIVNTFGGGSSASRSSGTAGRRDRRNSNSDGNRVMTIKDLPQPPRRGG